MKQIPRYDPVSSDPLSLKPALSQLFNNTLTDQWISCPLKDKLVIGNHNLDCSGAIQQSRYREFKTGRFDGIHLMGSSGRKFYTLSVLNILKNVQLTSSEYAYHQSCEQYKYQNRQKVRNVKNNCHSPTRKPNQINPNQQSGYYSVPTQNRFEHFSRNNQGN